MKNTDWQDDRISLLTIRSSWRSVFFISHDCRQVEPHAGRCRRCRRGRNRSGRRSNRWLTRSGWCGCRLSRRWPKLKRPPPYSLSGPGDPRSRARSRRKAAISSAVKDGKADFTRAAAPATCAAATPVPQAPEPGWGQVTPSSGIQYVTVLTPSGATRSGLMRPSFVGPRELNASNWSSRQSAAPTTSAPRASAGVMMLLVMTFRSSSRLGPQPMNNSTCVDRVSSGGRVMATL